MKQTDQHTSFTALDIQRYHAGELSMQERHALEKAALDDPFLADALEGYVHTSSAQSDLAALQQRLAAKTTTRKKRLFFVLSERPLLRIAALFLLFAGAGWAIYQFSFTTKEGLAITRVENKTAPLAPNSTDSTQQEVAESSLTVAPQQLPAQNTTASLPYRPIRPKQSPVVTPSPVSEAAGIIAAPVTLTEAAKDNTNEQQNAAAVNAAKESRMDMARKSTNPPILNTFRGQIVDKNGEPVPYANIQLNGRQNGITANTKGQFSLTTPDSIVNATVAAAGFQSNRVNLVNGTLEQKVVLNEANASLEEVVVTAYGKKRMSRSTTRPSDTKTKAQVEELEPEGGWPGFNDYITQNLHLPEEVTRKQLKGEVELSFEVDKNGEPTNIKVEKSLCTTCDQEAIRLLQEGPGWKKKKKKSGKVTIRF